MDFGERDEHLIPTFVYRQTLSFVPFRFENDPVHGFKIDFKRAPEKELSFSAPGNMEFRVQSSD